MKKALVFLFAVVIGLCFAFTGFAQDNTTSGPAKGGKQLTKGKYTQTKKKTQQTGGASAAQQSTQAATSTTPATPATPAAKVETPAAAPAKVQTTPASAGTQSTGPAKQGKQLTKGKYTQKKKNAGGAPAGQ